VVGREDDRCAICYRMRLERAAEIAVEGGFDAFSTSLLVSPYQKHDLLKEIAETVSADKGIEFMYRDYRDIWKQTYELSREMDMYRQKYCGCIYSEEERFRKKTQQPPCT
ncbi:MAG: epoxyqueuosine reductase QueH, partial [Candidatus Hydrogenedentes bacterium]|nr:epoxyqueuosine reductase QueH [Candidatus Hydrogenedentota bacterium]